MLLAGKNAVVTGSTRGLGRAYLVGLAEAGANVVVNGRNPDQCEALAQEINAGPGGNAVTFAESIASWDAGERIVETCIEAFGGIDILVNNAGIVRDRMIFNMTEEEYDEVLATNLKGHFACTRFASRHMRAQGSGRIINMTADSGLSGYTGNSNYSATKGAIATITRGWALELIKYGITVNAISPSAATEMTATIPSNIDDIKGSRGLTHGGRAATRTGQPEECAPIVVYLASDEAQEITGQIFGMGADRLSLYSHPDPKIRIFHEGGWTVDLVRERVPALIVPALESIELRI